MGLLTSRTARTAHSQATGFAGSEGSPVFLHLEAAVVFDGDDLMFELDEWEEFPRSGVRSSVTCTPDDMPVLSGHATITSLTIYYSC